MYGSQSQGGSPLWEIWSAWGILYFRQLLLRYLLKRSHVSIDHFDPKLACMGRPPIMTLWRSGLKCAAMVVRGSHLYACLATSCGSPKALTGGGGWPGVGLLT